MSVTMSSYSLEAAGAPLVRREAAVPVPAAGQALLEVLACGLCHTDLGYASGEVRPAKALPLVLGHEIVGTVVAAGDGAGALLGRSVLVPAVLPCGDCAFCRAGRGNACPHQRMPGNDIDGGFSTHVVVPAAPLVALDDAPADFDLRTLCVVADAVSTAWQAVHRSGLERGDLACVVGAGGVGGYVVQVAKALGAEVVACDVDPGRLRTLSDHGASLAVDVRERDPRSVRRTVHGHATGLDIPSLRWRIFECSGTPAGQELAFTLLARAATLVVVGFTPAKAELRLSNLMAFDARAVGTWGCPPAAYPAVLRLVYDRQVVLDPFVERGPMSRVDEYLADMAAHRLTRRMVMDPRA